jgi:hypothetical protein
VDDISPAVGRMTYAKLAEAAASAGWIARGGAAGLRAERDVCRTWGLRRRLRWALGRKR